jgi:BASS family bile acid:Na+ symporter
MKAVLDIGIPLVAILIMIPVGLDLTLADFRRVIESPRLVCAALAGQVLLLPLCAIGLVQILDLKPHIATGLLLIAACPAGGLSNCYTYLARARTALSVSLTALSCVAAVGTMPLIMAVYRLFGESIGFEVPAGRLIGHVFLMLVSPILAGMALRYYSPAFAARHDAAFRRVSLMGLGLLVGYIVSEEGSRVAQDITGTIVAAGMFVCLAMASGYGTGILAGGDTRDSFTLLIEFAVRNVAIATAIAVTVFGRLDFASFATAYFLIETPILFAGVLLFKMRHGRETRIPVACVQ